MAMKQKNNAQGRGWHGDPEGHARAGKEGGETVKEKYGPQFYREIGGKGGEASSGKFKKGDPRAKEAGRKGGEARSRNQGNQQGNQQEDQ